MIGLILSLILGFIIAFFALLNTETINFKYYFGTVETPVALLVMASAICGALAIGLLGAFNQAKAGLAIRGFRNKSMRLGKEVESLKDEKKASENMAIAQAEYETKAHEKEAE
jgi:uncharacterized integral membrane protein